jgi:catechol 2,3-dioxygenase-like lactoylglutathione lyase family enzyme
MWDNSKEAAMDQRLSLITLGVGDVSRARAFYEALGWHLDGGVDDETDHVAFFQTPGCIVALWGRRQLAEDSGVEDGGGWGGVTLAYNVNSPEEVDTVLAEAREAGARIARSGAATFWGGYSGVFVDPDGHPWEVAHNPGWTVHDDGRTTLT